MGALGSALRQQRGLRQLWSLDERSKPGILKKQLEAMRPPEVEPGSSEGIESLKLKASTFSPKALRFFTSSSKSPIRTEARELGVSGVARVVRL